MEHQVEKAKKNATEPQRILSKADVTRSWWLWWFSVEVANSFERLQALACCISMIPVLRKLYKKGDEFNAALKMCIRDSCKPVSESVCERGFGN